MEEEVLHNLFGVGIKEPKSGTGIALQICKEFIELQGGTIRAESKMGIGSTFYITIPIIISTK
jgi:signal transduction histidine kinase